jgi:ParB-like chromosome segregation protein Spo0J
MAAQYQLLPDLAEDEYEALKADIAERGVQVPIERDETGAVLDGHHRLRACEELGITEYPTIIRTGMDEDEKRRHVLALNLDRRHLTREQKRELVARLLVATPEVSNRQIAEQAKVSDHTVADVRSRIVPRAQNAHGDSTVDTLGRRQAAHRPSAVITTTPQQTQQALDILQTSSAEPPKPLSTATELRHAARDAARAAGREDAEQRASELVSDPAWAESAFRLICADIAGGMPDIPDESVDFIITDPPYPQEHLQTYSALGALAARVLKPGGSLLAMAGQSYLPEVMARLSERLAYHWTVAYLTPGGQAVQLWQRKVNTFWKPVLWYTNGEYEGEWIGDVSRSAVNDNDKSLHDWGQSESGMADLIERFTEPGDTILDPFVGGGTTAVVAVSLARYVIAADIDQRQVDITAGRLAALAPNGRPTDGD